MRGILAAVVAGILSLGLATGSRAQMPVALDPLAGSYGQYREQCPVVYAQTPYGGAPIGLDSTMFPNVYFGGCRSGYYPTWAIPYSPMRSKFYGSERIPRTWRGEWGGDF
jgi:hypothetical protein